MRRFIAAFPCVPRHSAARTGPNDTRPALTRTRGASKERHWPCLRRGFVCGIANASFPAACSIIRRRGTRIAGRAALQSSLRATHAAPPNPGEFRYDVFGILTNSATHAAPPNPCEFRYDVSEFSRIPLRIPTNSCEFGYARFVGSDASRFAARHSAATLNQPPPRITRLEPVAAPTGSTGAAASPPYAAAYQS